MTGYGDSANAIPILVINSSRIDVIKDVPAIKEFGVDVRVSSERGIAAPKALPEEIVERLQQAIKSTLEDPQFLATIKNDAPVVAYMPGPEWTQSLERIREELKPFVSKMND